MVKKYLAYLRVSTVVQRKDNTIKNQVERLKEYDTNNDDIKIVDYIKDDGESGFRAERDGYKYLKEQLHKRSDIHGVITTKIDRLGRDAFELLKFQKEIVEELGKELKMTTMNIDTTNKVGKLQFQQLCAFAEYQARDIIERLQYARKLEYQKNPHKFGRPKKQIPALLQKRIIRWYTIHKDGFHRICKLIQTEDIDEYPDWFKEKYSGFGKEDGKEDDKFYISPMTIRSRLIDWNVKLRKKK